MRRSKEDAAQTRQDIVEAASRLFRKRGIGSVSVADVMGELGLTVGGFYRHFDSKDALAAEAIAFASESTTRGAREAVDVINAYVSLEHVKHPEAGCPVAALCSEIAPRAPPAARSLRRGARAHARAHSHGPGRPAGDGGRSRRRGGARPRDPGRAAGERNTVRRARRFAGAPASKAAATQVRTAP